MLPLHAPVFAATLATALASTTLVAADDLGVLFATRHSFLLKKLRPESRLSLRAVEHSSWREAPIESRVV